MKNYQYYVFFLQVLLNGANSMMSGCLNRIIWIHSVFVIMNGLSCSWRFYVKPSPDQWIQGAVRSVRNKGRSAAKRPACSFVVRPAAFGVCRSFGPAACWALLDKNGKTQELSETQKWQTTFLKPLNKRISKVQVTNCSIALRQGSYIFKKTKFPEIPG